MNDVVLSVDIGTTSLKAGFISATGEVVAFNRQIIPFSRGRFVALRWKRALWRAVKVMMGKGDGTAVGVHIKAIVVSGNGPTIVSKSGRTLRWNEKVNYDLLGIPLEACKTSLFLPRILAFRSLFPQDFEQSKMIFSGPEFLIYQLCGKAVTILPEARFEDAYWTFEQLDRLGIPQEKLPDFAAPGTICGYEKNGIPVIAGGPDFVAALIGTNTLSPGKICDRSGSSEGINFCVEKPVTAPELRTLPSVVPGLWNVSFLIPESSCKKPGQRIEAVKNGVEALEKAAVGEDFAASAPSPSSPSAYFPNLMTATGGQVKDPAFMEEKARKIGMKIAVCQCPDAELLGDAVLGWTALKKYSTLQKAADSIVKETKIYGNI